MTHEYYSNDPESEEVRKEYKDLVAQIKRRMDPRSNAVLVVDDEVTIRKRVARDIRRSHPEVVIFEASNGREALDQLQEIRRRYGRDPLFIVLDLMMPVMDGWGVIDRLREEYEGRGDTQGIPIIVLSSTSGEKGALFFRKSIHAGKSKYSPLVSVAKEACINPKPYDARGEKGLIAWIEFFLREGRPGV